ncbi:MAG: Panacea domain-containing protein [Patescibacteria group bacterium]
MNNLELEKIKNSVAYLSSQIPNLYLTKLLKIFYYFDFISVLETGRPITNDTYYHLPYGPIPTFIKDQLTLLKYEVKKEEAEVLNDGFIYGQLVNIFTDIIEFEANNGNFILKNKKDADKTYLSEYELGLLDDIISEFKNTTSSELVTKTHSEVPYSQTSMLNVIDYKLAFHLDRSKILPNRNFDFNIEVSQAEFYNS